MDDLYYTLASQSFSTGQGQLARQAGEELGLSQKDVVKFLESQDLWTLHKPAKRNFPRLPMLASNVDKQWQADLVEMIPLARFNGGKKYILTVIDVVSRYAFTRAIADKTSRSVSLAFEDIFRKSKRVCDELFTDQGREFTGSEMKRLLAKKRIIHIQSASEKKAAMCERFNRTLKTIMYKFFTFAKTKRWTGILQVLTAAYNSRIHRMTSIAPAKMNYFNQTAAFSQPSFRVLQKPKFVPNQKVRISYLKIPFRKGYAQSFSTEIFKIKRVIPGPVITYKLADSDDRLIDGRSYEHELVAAP